MRRLRSCPWSGIGARFEIPTAAGFRRPLRAAGVGQCARRRRGGPQAEIAPTANLPFCSSSSAPTRQTIAARSGKMSPTLVRRLISPGPSAGAACRGSRFRRLSSMPSLSARARPEQLLGDSCGSEQDPNRRFDPGSPRLSGRPSNHDPFWGLLKH